MISDPGTIWFGTWVATARTVVRASALFLVFSAHAQEIQNPSQGSSQTPGATATDAPVVAPAPNPSFAPGFADTLGRWLEEGTNKFKSDLQGAQEKLDQLGNQTRDAAKDATGAVIGLPNTRIVAARERCATAQNGGPDCQTAATTLCQGKGFQTGKSLDTQSERKCPPRLLLERRTPNDAECPTEIFVTRAMCQ